MLLYYLKTFAVWLLRCGYSRGFGVHSPSAYGFIRYVINEHNPYYAYAELKKKYVYLPPLIHKMGRLFFRLANFWQPYYFYCNDEIFFHYAQAGCCQLKKFDLEDLLSKKQVTEEKSKFSDNKNIVVIDAVSHAKLLLSLVDNCDSNTLLVLTSLPKLSNKTWQTILDMQHVGRTYNLYYCGIIFFDRTIYKQHYQVNF